MACDSHVFSLTDMATSLVTEFDLVCGDQWLLPLSQSVFFAGVLVGAAVYGHLGDLLGRRSAFLLGMVQTTTAGIAAAFAPNLACYCVLMFITAMGQVGLHTAQFPFLNFYPRLASSSAALCLQLSWWDQVGESSVVLSLNSSLWGENFSWQCLLGGSGTRGQRNPWVERKEIKLNWSGNGGSYNWLLLHLESSFFHTSSSFPNLFAG